jgi:hypothetical protein
VPPGGCGLPRPVAYERHCVIAGIDLWSVGVMCRAGNRAADNRVEFRGNEERTLAMRRAALRPVFDSILAMDYGLVNKANSRLLSSAWIVQFIRKPDGLQEMSGTF